MPGARIHPPGEAGRPCAASAARDSCGFELADVFIGADGPTELLAKCGRCLEHLDFDLEPLPEAA